MAWHKPYNVSGSVEVGDRLNALLTIVGILLGTDRIGITSHFTGATTVCGQSDRALFISTGFEWREFFAQVSGNRQNRVKFARELENALQQAMFRYSIVVHESQIHE